MRWKFWRKPEQRYDVIMASQFTKLKLANVSAKEATDYLNMAHAISPGKSLTIVKISESET